MTPKYRGDEEDWLDSEGSSRGREDQRQTKRASPKKAAPLPSESANATVAEVFPNQCRVRLDQAEEESAGELLCRYRRSEVFGYSEGGREKAPVAVGDRVRVQKSGADSGLVDGLCARRNFLLRPAAGQKTRQVVQVIVANMDRLVIVASVREPEFSPGLIDRYLVAAQIAGIIPVICVTKIDLRNEPAGLPGLRIYRDLGFETFEVSAKRGDGIEGLRSALLGRAAVFCGHSGVGKTSLLRTMIGSAFGRVGEVSRHTGKGRHTTTSAVLLTGPGDSQWVDTPGVREFGLSQVAPEELAGFFPEFAAASCESPGCIHLGEPGCQVRERAGSFPRYSSYLRIYESLVSGLQR